MRMSLRLSVLKLKGLVKRAISVAAEGKKNIPE